MIYIVCLKLYFCFFEDYVNSILFHHKVIQVIEPINTIYNKLKLITESDENYKFIILTTPKMYRYKLNNFDCNRIYILNTEQLSKGEELKKIIMYNKLNYKIVDYSIENISIFKSIYLPYQVNPNEIYNYKKILDVCYIGKPFGTYRLNILNELKTKCNLNIIGDNNTNTWGNAWGKERDEIAFKHKILINIHHDTDYLINEQLRINRCIFNKVLVISETGLNNDSLFLKPYIIFEKYDNLINKVLEVLNNYDYYYNKIYNNFDIEIIKKHYNSISQKNYSKICDNDPDVVNDILN